VRGGLVGLDASDGGGEGVWLEVEGVADFDGSRGEGASDDSADAFDREGAVNGEVRVVLVEMLGGGGEVRGEFFFEGVDALAVVRGDGVNVSICVASVGDLVADHFGDEVEVVGVVNEVGFGEGNLEARDIKVGEDLEVFFGLRHPAIVGGNDEEGEVEGGDTGDHVVDEVGVTGDIDEASFDGGRFIREGEVGEAELDSDAP